VGLAVSPDGTLAASGGDDNTIWLWDLKASKGLVSIREHSAGVVTLAFSPDGKTLASATPGSEDCLVRLWEVPSGLPKGTLGGPSRGIWSLAYSPDGTLLACAGFDQALTIFEMPSGKLLHTIPNVTKDRMVRTIAVSEKNHVATGGSDFARLWDAGSGKEIPSNLPAHFCPTFLPGGQRLAGWRYTTGQVILCDSPSGQKPQVWRAHAPNITGLAVSPDGRWLATTGSDGASLWSAADGKLLTKLVGHQGQAASAAFTPDGRRLVTSGEHDFTVRVWELPPVFHARADPGARGMVE
jgi:WD40 repeat protein